MSLRETVVPRWQRLAAGGAGLIGAIALFTSVSLTSAPVIALPIAGLAIAALAVHLPRLGPQLLSRAIWWSNVVLGLVLVLLGSGRERPSGSVLAVASGAALLVIGQKGLAEAREHGKYRPAAFGATLQLLMVLALADSQMLLIMGLVDEQKGHPGALLLLGSGSLLVIGFIGLYRLALWGVVVNFVTSLALGVVLLARIVDVDDRFSRPALALVALQLAVPAPMLLSLVTSTPLPNPSRRARALAAWTVILACMLVAVGGTLLRR